MKFYYFLFQFLCINGVKEVHFFM